MPFKLLNTSSPKDIFRHKRFPLFCPRAALRICSDENGKINKSVIDTKGEILLVSQFTLYANATHGNRPDFLQAESPDRAEKLYLYAAEGLKRAGIPVKLGVFGAHMQITQVNDGPFTLLLEK